MEGESKKIEVLVADTTAFIQNAPLQDLADKVVTVAEVIKEVKSKRQLSRLVVLPYDLEIKNVYPESLKAVKDFALKTGDYTSLSLTDLMVMALTYQLEKEKVGADHIRQVPVQQLPTVTTKRPEVIEHWGGRKKSDTKQNGDDQTQICDGQVELNLKETSEKEDSDGGGWVTASNKHKRKVHRRHKEIKNEEKDKKQEKEEEEVVDNKKQVEKEIEVDDVDKKQEAEEEVEESDEDVEEKIKQIIEHIDDLECDDIFISSKDVDNEKEEGEEEEDDEEEENDDDEEEGEEEEEEDDSEGGFWITPENVKEVMAQMTMGSSQREEKHVKVACMTTDYAMQNVLKQMNLNVAALDGRIIKNLRIYVFRCYACFKITRNMTLRFCPKCGNQTLKKVGTSLGDDGRLIVHINARKHISAKGKRYLGSMPRIKGGKHPNNIIIVPDQPMADNKPSRVAKTKTNVLADTYVGSLSGFSPFALRDTTSKSAILHIKSGSHKYMGSTNPRKNKK